MIQLTNFNNIIVIISFIVNLTFLGTLLIKIYNYFTKKKYIKSILSFNNDVIISHAVFNLTTEIGITNNFITFNSLNCISHIIQLLDVIEQKYDLLGITTDYKNEINIGGIVMNKKVNAYFSKHFPNFKYITDRKYKEAYDKYPIDHTLIKYSSNKFGFLINETDFYEIKYGFNDYAFLIKMTQSDFKHDNKNSVHILFGAGAIGTEKATEYLLTHYKQIYKEYKNNHYFFAIEINLIDNSFNEAKGIIDLTNDMF